MPPSAPWVPPRWSAPRPRPLAPLFEGEDVPERDLFWRTRNGRALRRGDLKYVRLNNTDYLYDLGTDVREQANLAAKRPGDLAELRSAWEAVNATLLAYA